MKKNLLSVLILALVLANLILSAILAFSIIPQTKKANELINKVCNAIDLELESGKNIQVPVGNIKEYNIDAEFMCNLKDNGNDYTVNDGTKYNSKETPPEPKPLAENNFTYDDGSKANDNGTDTHAYVTEPLLLHYK